MAVTKVSEIPIVCSLWKSRCCGTVSKAFLKSTKQHKTLEDLCRASSMIARSVKIWSIVRKYVVPDHDGPLIVRVGTISYLVDGMNDVFRPRRGKTRRHNLIK